MTTSWQKFSFSSLSSTLPEYYHLGIHFPERSMTAQVLVAVCTAAEGFSMQCFAYQTSCPRDKSCYDLLEAKPI